MPIVHLGVDRQQLDGRHAQFEQMTDGRLRSQTGIAPSQRFGNARVLHGESADVRLVDHRLVPGRTQLGIVAPVEFRIDDHCQGGTVGVVPVIEGKVRIRVADAVPEHRIGPAQVASDRLDIGIEHDLVRIEPVSLLRIVRAVHAITVKLTKLNVGQIAVPDNIGLFRQRDTMCLFPVS